MNRHVDVSGVLYQSSRRGFVHLAVVPLDQHPRPSGVFEHARIVSQLTAALADAAVVGWIEKERYGIWRPVTAIRLGGYDMVADLDWEPLIGGGCTAERATTSCAGASSPPRSSASGDGSVGRNGCATPEPRKDPKAAPTTIAVRGSTHTIPLKPPLKCTRQTREALA